MLNEFGRCRGYFEDDYDFSGIPVELIKAYNEVCEHAISSAQMAITSGKCEGVKEKALYWEAAARGVEQTINAMVDNEFSPLCVLLDKGNLPQF